MALLPGRSTARSPSATCASNSISPSLAMRNSTPLPDPTICPGSTARVSTSPLAGARMSSRPVRARCSASWATATLTRALAASRVAVRWSMSAALMKPRPTSALARSSCACASLASARATSTCAASELTCCTCTDRSITASTCPARTQSPGCTSTLLTMPPSPTTPTGISIRAPSDPVAVTVRATVDWPGLLTVTTGTCAVTAGAAAPPPRIEIHTALPTSATTITAATSHSRRLRVRASSSSMTTAESAMTWVS